MVLPSLLLASALLSAICLAGSPAETKPLTLDPKLRLRIGLARAPIDPNLMHANFENGEMDDPDDPDNSYDRSSFGQGGYCDFPYVELLD